MKLACALCLHDIPSSTPGKVRRAITVQGGTAVCGEHLPYVHDSNLTAYLLLRRKHREANR